MHNKLTEKKPSGDSLYLIDDPILLLLHNSLKKPIFSEEDGFKTVNN